MTWTPTWPVEVGWLGASGRVDRRSPLVRAGRLLEITRRVKLPIIHLFARAQTSIRILKRIEHISVFTWIVCVRMNKDYEYSFTCMHARTHTCMYASAWMCSCTSYFHCCPTAFTSSSSSDLIHHKSGSLIFNLRVHNILWRATLHLYFCNFNIIWNDITGKFSTQ